QVQRLEQDARNYRMQREAEVRNQLKAAPNDFLAQVMTEYLTRRKLLNDKLVELEGEYEDRLEQIRQKGQHSGELRMLESEIEQLTEIERTMDYRLRSFDVKDQTARDQITVMQNAF